VPVKKSVATAAPAIEAQLAAAIAWLRSHASQATRDGMARYGIPGDHALGVPMKDIKQLGKQLGRHHQLAQALWASGIYEARMLTQFVADPMKISAAEMDRWCKSFDNWAYCDALSFNLFDRTPHAWKMVDQWTASRQEFVRRTAFALLWSLALHDRNAPDHAFRHGLQLIEDAATDDRHFVKKAVSMALKAIARRPALKAAAAATAGRLAATDDSTARWIGRDALRDFSRR